MCGPGQKGDKAETGSGLIPMTDETANDETGHLAALRLAFTLMT